MLAARCCGSDSVVVVGCSGWDSVGWPPSELSSAVALPPSEVSCSPSEVGEELGWKVFGCCRGRQQIFGQVAEGLVFVLHQAWQMVRLASDGAAHG